MFMESHTSGEAIEPERKQLDLPSHLSAEDNALESPRQISSAQKPLSPKSPQPKKQNNSKPEKEKNKEKSPNLGKSNGPSTKSLEKPPSEALPEFVIQRNLLFDALKRRHDAELLEKEHPTINVALDLGLDKDGKPRPAMLVMGKAWESTPGSFLKHVDKDITTDVVIAKVNGKELWDLDRPLEYECRVSYVPFSSAEGRNVFWHSSAHVLGEAAECQYHCLLSHGPPVEQGFFYDMAIAEGYALGDSHVCTPANGI